MITSTRVQNVKFKENLKSALEPSSNLVVDETLYSFRGRCAFIQYIPKKPSKFGIKYNNLVDVATNYLFDSNVYVGRDENADPSLSCGFRFVDELLKPFYGTFRTLTVDNFYTSIPLAKHLYSNNLFLVGTLKSNKV